ncbi:MAG: hypothetical protein JOZ84_07455 [Methylobacteriaceae bacterium]|nr:hypothetical protein [Methylobacteriaceae bacterium]MBV9394231.1 hypothetical protein [Methylobacteriaceae bacterium]
MRHRLLQTQLESIARDAAVKADHIANRTTTNARLGETLQRLYAPVCDEQADRFDSVLMSLDQRFSRRG